VAFAALLCSLAVEWVSLGRFAGGTLKVFHVGAGLFVVACALHRGVRSGVRPFLRSARWLYGPWLLFLFIVGLFGLVHANPYFPRPELLRQAGYGLTSIAVGAYFATGAALDHRRVLRWAAAAVSATVVLGLGYSAAKGGTNPLTLLADALRAGDPDVLSRLFRVAFRSQGLEEANVNLRHKVFAAVLIGCYVALATGAAQGREGRRRLSPALGASITGAGALVVVSLSRSLALALGLCLAIVAVRMVLRGRARPRHAALLGLSLAVIVVAFASPVGGLLESRFVEETGSYASRADAAADSVALLSSTALTGAGAEAVERSPHNLLLDAWLSGGVLAFALAATWALAFVRIWAREARRYVLSQAGWVLPVSHVAVIGLGLLPLVRLFTAGQGWHLTEWVAVGIVAGLVCADRVSRSRPATPAPDRRQGAPQALRWPGRDALGAGVARRAPALGHRSAAR
jgi:hypothetical protein